MEPKEEPINDFAMPGEKETVRQSAFLLKKPKEEPLELCLFENEASHFVVSSFSPPRDNYPRPSFSLEPKEEIIEGKKHPSQGVTQQKIALHKGSSLSKSKKPGALKLNATELECHKCEVSHFVDIIRLYRTRSSSTWVGHLRYKHSTTPTLEGLALRCDCGHESRSNSHNYLCNVSNYTIIRKTGTHRWDKTSNWATIQCVLCKVYPTTASGYAYHLHMHHKSSLHANGIYLICSCGREFRSQNNDCNHSKMCDSRQFTLHNLNE